MPLLSAQPPDRTWFVARTRFFRQELKIRDWLNDRGVENFVPTVCSDRRRVKEAGRQFIEKPAAPNLVFVKTDKASACALVADFGLPMQYIIDCATHRMLVVPEKEMSDFQRVFDLSKDHGGLMDRPLKLGDRVRITKGALRGVDGYVLEILGCTYVAVGLMGVLWAKAKVPRAYLELR